MTETASRPTFLGIQIEGDINRSDRKAQRPLAEFQQIVQAVLDDPTVVEFGWRQYTPYFNDGETCVFSGHGAWVRLDTDPAADDPDDPGHYGLEIGYGSKDRIGERAYEWRGSWPNRERIPLGYTGPDETRYDRLMTLENAIDDDEFCDVLLDLFGDHANVTVRRTGIQVDFYEHE